MRFVSGILGGLFCLGLSAGADPTIEDYAAPREFSAADISEDGSRISLVHAIDGEEFLCVITVADRSEQCFANLRDLRPNYTYFLDDEHVLVLATQRTRVPHILGERYDESTPFLVNIETGDVERLVRRVSNLHPAQTGFGRIVAISPDRETVYIPAFNASSTPELDVFAIEVQRGRGRRVIRGGSDTTGWLVSPSGDPIARENYDSDDNVYTVEVPDGDDWRTIYSSDEELRTIYLRAVTQDRQHAVFVQTTADRTADGVYFMSLENGDITGPFHVSEGREIGQVISNDDGEFIGVEYTGISASYAMLDEDLNAAMERLVNGYGGANIKLIDLSADGTRVLAHVSGRQFSGNYIVYDLTTQSVAISLAQRGWIDGEAMASADSIEYQSRDGLTISAVVTTPRGTQPGNGDTLPMVVMPHGGPESHDTIGYDWMAQAIANEGYLVLQPNFRGSSGFGAEFTEAGRGEWGGAMQHDVTDGVELLIRAGWADPDRICIVGWSYGGYSALMSSVLNPEMYQCTASIAGVSDLYRMLSDVSLDRGDDSQAYRYWTDQYGRAGVDRDVLEPISPYYRADEIQAPVLLLHGDDDMIVPPTQSRRMEDALDDAGRQVRIRTFSGQNHSIMDEESRVEVLREVISFVDQHIGEAGP